MSEITCYMCDAPKTSVEHVPPRCLFPEVKDSVGGVDLRKHLITVPACDRHNMDKSHDDEYLMYVLVLGILNNDTATQQVRTKIQRAIEKKPAVARLIAQHQVKVTLEEIESGAKLDAVALRLDGERVRRALEHVGRALYFHHFKQKWFGDVQAIPLFLIDLENDNSEQFNNSLESLRAGVEQVLSGTDVHGANPDVFTYQLAQVAPQPGYIMLLHFYRGSKTVLVFKASEREDQEPETAGTTLPT